MRKRKKKVKKIFIFLIFIIIVIGIYLFLNDNNSTSQSNYSSKTLEIAASEDILDKLDENNYSKTLEEVLLNYLFIDKYFDEYLVIEYQETNNFLNNINSYLNTGYSGSEINDIYTLSSLNQEKLLDNTYIDFSKYLNITNFDVLKFDRYETYISDSNLDHKTAVTYVNIGLDNESYTNTKATINPNDLNALVNKYNYLEKDFIPNDLVTIPGTNLKMNSDASTKFVELISAAKEDGFNFVPTTAYRDYNWQNTLYTNYSNTDGKELADTYSARPGYSEHQLGLAIDIKNPTYHSETGIRLNDEDYKWVLDNAHKYGYIVRYPKDSTDITGYIEEPWHLRYLGVDLATDVVESTLTYDEYYDLYIMEY